MEKINACIVGLGAIGPVHAMGAAGSQKGRVYAICDCIKERADKYGEMYGAKVYYSFDEVLEDKNINVVHICTPHYLHEEMAVRVLESGKNLVLEKPVAITFSQLEKLERVYKRSGKKACIMLQNRTNTCVRMMKELIDSDTSLGKILGIAGFLTWNRDMDYYLSEPWRGRWETEGGGLLINQAIHILDLIAWLGGGVEKIRSSISNKRLDELEVEDTADALFLMKNGCHGVLYATNAFLTDSPVRVEAVFENATLRYADGRLYRIDRDVNIIASDSDSAPGKKYWGNGHSGVINSFYNAVCDGTDDYLDLTEGLHSARVLLSMYKQGMEKGKEWIKI